jgi:SNF2 family DNA or RNA helicase
VVDKVLVKELEEGNLAKVHLSEKLRSLNSFSGIKNYPLPSGFKGELRPYQKAGYNWLRFLNEYKLGGCLADDMGLGHDASGRKGCRFGSFPIDHANIADL